MLLNAASKRKRMGRSFQNAMSGAIAAGLLSLVGPICSAGVINLNFEGIDTYPDGNTVLIQNYYNGGSASNGAIGPNYGVTFSSGALLLCLDTSVSTGCSNASKGGQGVPGSDDFAMFFPSTNPTMDVAGGFDTGFAMAYSNAFATTLGIQIWSGLDGTGTLLASGSLPGTGDGASNPACFSSDYCPFSAFSLGFSGTAQSVVFTGTGNQSVYDDITFGSTSLTSSAPEPGSGLMIFAGLLISAAAYGRRFKTALARR